MSDEPHSSPVDWRPRFASVWLGQTASQLGSGMTGFALGVWVYQRSGSVTQFAIALLANTLPVVLSAPWAGALADRFSRRKVMLASDTVAGLCTAVLMLLLTLGQLQLWQIYLATACNALARSCQWPAYSASIPQLVPAQNLTRANGLLQLSQGISQLAAPLLGGLMISRLPIASVFLVDLCTFAIAVITLASVRFPARIGASKPSEAWYRGSGDAWRAWRTHKGLYTLTLLIVLGNFTAGSVEVLVTPLVLSFTTPAALGVLMTIGGLGMVGGSVGLGIWGGARRLVVPLLISEAIAGCAMILAGARPDFIILAVASLLFFGASPVSAGCHHSLLQRELDPAIHGRVFAILNAATSVALMLGYVGTGPLVDHFFEPMMAADGFLASSLGSVIGVGKGRGAGLVFVLMGSASLLAVGITALRASVRRVDSSTRERGAAEKAQ
jgi:MFS transporter, DHA3 family, macrolide efflux protein